MRMTSKRTRSLGVGEDRVGSGFGVGGTAMRPVSQVENIDEMAGVRVSGRYRLGPYEPSGRVECMNEDVDGRVPHADAINYVLRTAQQNTLHLSAMADQKASVVLGASFVMASIVFSDVAGESDPAIASILLAVTAVASGLLAAFAVMPRVMTSVSTSDRRNLLFFGTVAGMDHDDYLEQMHRVIGSAPAIYDAILEDLYQASHVLMRRKYRLLRLSYVALTVGMVATLIAVLVQS
jgi:hypothetical protein